MIKLIFIIFFSILIPNQKKEIIKVLEEYNQMFIKADYSKIINHFNYPVSFNLSKKTITASNKLKLKLIYKKLRGSLSDDYSYSTWDKINIQLIDNNIAIVNADFSRYDKNDISFYSSSAIYHLRLIENNWKIFSLTPYSNTETLN